MLTQMGFLTAMVKPIMMEQLIALTEHKWRDGQIERFQRNRFKIKCYVTVLTMLN